MTKFISIDKDTQEKKETFFTHWLTKTGEWSEYRCMIKDIDKIVYLGKCSIDGDLFAGYHNSTETITMYKGTKGDEFN